MQVFDSKIYFFTVRYVKNNLFVIISQFEVNIPTCINQFESFIKYLSKLFTFQKYAKILAHTANVKLKTARDNCDSNMLKKSAFDLRSNLLPHYLITAFANSN